MLLNNREKRTHLVLITLLIISQIYFGLIGSVATGDTEHSYVIFQDDFEDGVTEDWVISIPPDAPLGSAWAVELDDNNHVFCVKKRVEVWGGERMQTWTNYTYEVKVKLLVPEGGMISFRTGGGGGFGLAFGETRLSLHKWIPPSGGELKHLEEGLNLNMWYTFKIVCVGNSIEIYVDDVLKFSYVDEEDPILSGGIGFEGFTESHTHFDDFKVSTTHRLYVTCLIKDAEDEINKARMIEADTVEAEGKLAEAQDAFDNGDLSGAELLAKEAINLAQHAPVGYVSVNELLEYPVEYNKHTVEILGTIKDILYEQGVYGFTVDDGTAVISATFNGTLEDTKSEDEVKVVGMFNASTRTVIAESLEKMWPPTEGPYTFLVFKDDFEDGDFADWAVHIDPEVEDSEWKVEKENGNHVLSGKENVEAWVENPEWTDYILEFKAKLIKDSLHIHFHVAEYILHLYHTHMSLAKETILKQVDLDLDPDAWYHLKIVCLENNILILFNDHLKIEYTDEDNPLLPGNIGFHVTGHALFDDVKVSKIATTSVVNDLITYTQTEIDKAKEINADVSAAELKLEQAEQALDQEDYQMVQYLVDEAVWLAKRSSIGQISITNLKAMGTKCSGHVVTITGTVKNLEARYGVGYDFVLDDETDRISVTYQSALVDIGNDYNVTVTGIFDAPKETVTASKIEKISGTPTPTPPPSGATTLDIQLVATFISVCGAAAGAGAWIVRIRGARKRRKILFQQLMDEVDDIYSRFKMKTLRCEAELYKLRDQVLEEFKQNVIDEEKYTILNTRIDNYLKEVKEKIAEDKAS